MRTIRAIGGGAGPSVAAAACAGLTLLVAGCGATPHPVRSRHETRLPADYLPLTLGPGPRYRPVATSARVRAAAPIDGEHCLRRAGERFGAHLEVFAHQHVVAIPAGIGIAPPLVLGTDATVLGGRCSYPARTTDPTGVIDVRKGARVTLGELFDIWGQALGKRIIARFRAPAGSIVVAYVDGRRFTSDPRAIALVRHELIVLEVASRVPPHRVYRFRKGI
jgi:hypothetical protein